MALAAFALRNLEHSSHGRHVRSAVLRLYTVYPSLGSPGAVRWSRRFLSAAVRACPQPLPNRPYVTLPSTKLPSLAAVSSVALLLSNSPRQLQHIGKSSARNTICSLHCLAAAAAVLRPLTLMLPCL